MTEDDDSTDNNTSHAARGRKGGRPSGAGTEELIAALEDAMQTTGAPFATTGEITERVDLADRTVRKKLGELVDDLDSPIASRRVGSGRVYWFQETDSKK